MPQNVVYRIFDLVRAHWLKQHLSEPRRIRGAREVPGGEHYQQMGPKLLCLFRQFDSARIRHHHVSEKHVNVFLRENSHGFYGAAGCQNAQPLFSEYLRDGSPDEIIIVNKQNGKRPSHDGCQRLWAIRVPGPQTYNSSRVRLPILYGEYSASLTFVSIRTEGVLSRS